MARQFIPAILSCRFALLTPPCLPLHFCRRGRRLSADIPGDTGCISRTCAALALGLHLVGPLGFQIDNAKLKNAGLDYWPYVVVKVHSFWVEFQDYFKQQDGEKQLLAFTKTGTITHSDFSFRCGDLQVFGSETSGLLPEVLNDCTSRPYGGGTLRIPMVGTYVRCLNLSVCAHCSGMKHQGNLDMSSCNSILVPLIVKVFMEEDIFC